MGLKKLAYAGIHCKLASVRELRGDSTDFSQKKADLDDDHRNTSLTYNKTKRL